MVVFRLGPLSSLGINSEDQRRRIVTFHFGEDPTRTGSRPHVGEGQVLDNFIWAFPKNPLDRRQGGYCALSGYWFPGHRMVEINGKRYGDVFAPEDKE